MHDEDPEQRTGGSGDAAGRASAAGTPSLGHELGGDLPCVVCGYNLRGLSIRGVCPECGTLVRATILAVVDPHAAELQPVRRPPLVAAGMLLWIGGALAAAALCWAPHIAEALGLAGLRVAKPVPRFAAAAAVGLSGLGALALLRPQRRTPIRATLAAGVGVLLYPLLAWTVWLYLSALAEPLRRGTGTYLANWHPGEPERWRVLSAVLIVAIIICLRPVARLLVARSLLLRTGRVDRQTLLGIAAAAGVGAAGDAIGLLSASLGDAARVIGLILVAVGALLLTMGLVGSLIDGVRIASSILRPGPSLKQVLHGSGHSEGGSPR